MAVAIAGRRRPFLDELAPAHHKTSRERVAAAPIARPSTLSVLAADGGPVDCCCLCRRREVQRGCVRLRLVGADGPRTARDVARPR